MIDTTMNLTDLIQLEKLQSIIERLHASIKNGCCIVDPHGKILVEKGWQCFCRKHQSDCGQEKQRSCIETEHFFAGRLQPGQKCHLFTCSNGFSSLGVPIRVGGLHIASMFIGVFILDGRRQQAEPPLSKGASTGPELTAFTQGLPVFTAEKVQRMADHLELFVDLIGEMGRNHLQERRLLSARQRSEEHLRDLVDSLPQVVFETDRQGRVTFFNQSAFAILGYTAEQLEHGLDRSSCIPERERDHLDARFNRILAGEIMPSVECTIRRSNGQLFEAILSSRPLYDSSDRVIGVRGLIFDISVHKEAQRALWESEQRYRLLFDKSLDALLLTEDMRIIECNAKAVELFQIARRELQGTALSTLMEKTASANRQQLVGELSMAVQESARERKPLDWIFTRSDNRQVETEVFVDSIDLQGRTLVQLTLRDVTLERLNQRTLETREAAWNALFQHSPFGIAINRLNDGTYLDVNPALEHFSGRKAEELIGKPAGIFLPASQNAKSLTVTRQLLEKGYSGLQEAEVFRRDGSTGYVFYSAATFQSGDETNAVSMVVDISERREMEKRLRQSEATLKSLFRTVPVGLAILKDREFLAVNDRLAEITGYDVEEMVGKTSRFLYFNEDDFAAVGRTLYDHEAANGRNYVETIFRHKEGFSRHISLFSAPLDPAAPEAGAAVAVQDITEEREMVHALRESEERYRSLFEASGDAILLSKDGIFIDCNQKTLDIFRCTPKDILGKSSPDISPPLQASGQESSALIAQLRGQAMHHGSLNFEWIHSRPDGTTFESEVSLRYIETLGKGVMQSIIRDISERKKSERILRENEFRFRSFFHTNPEGILLIDFAGNILDANKAFLQRSGYNLVDCRMTSFTAFVPEQNRAKLLQWLSDLKSGIKETHALQTTCRAKNGELIPVSLRSWVVTDEASTPLYFGVFIHDLTREMKLAEDKVALEKQVIRAQKSEAIGTLASGIAHDFNNILGGIIGYTELAIFRDPAAIDLKTREYLERVLEGSNRAKGLVQQILRFSRNSDVVMEPVSTLSVMQETVHLLQSTIPSTIGIEQHFRVDNDQILGDSNQVHQVIMNLATNAYHAMRETGGTLMLQMDNLTLKEAKRFMSMTIPPGEYVRISVADTGCGMSASVLERIFEPYFTTKKVNEGTGLGMAVVLGIVKSHKGLIHIDSKPGQGTLFEVYLPIYLGEVTQQASAEPSLPRGDGQRILIVDDEAYFQEVVDENLKTLGYKVTSCRSSLEALHMFRANPGSFDLLVTDQTMPELTGVQLIGEVRSIDDTLPVILCTGFSEVVTEQSAEYYGINRFLMKPISIHDLARAVADVLRLANSGGNEEKRLLG